MATVRDESKSIEEGFKHSITVVSKEGEEVNASGHPDRLKRQYSLLDICGLALTIDNAWIALGGSITVAIYNGGPPGVFYEVLTACFYYAFIGASIAELASSIPSAGGVYHWASITARRRYGRVLGFFTGSINFFGWMFDLASIVNIATSVIVQLYAVFHSDLVIQPWHVYVAYLIITWFGALFVIFLNRLIPLMQELGLTLIIVGGLVTIIVVAAMPEQHASSSFIWSDWVNQTGWPSGVAFLTGVLNGAFAVGTAVAAQLILGCITAFCYAVAILYAISDLEAVLTSNASFPLAAVYAQATRNQAAPFGLLLIIFLSLMICIFSTYLAVGRLCWALARDNATPLSGLFSKVNESLSCPIPATLFCAVLCTGLGAIPLASETAFTDLVGSLIILTTTLYACAILPHMLTKRMNVPRGPFWMGTAGYLVNGAAVLLITFFSIMFCFPYVFPSTVDTMNYKSVILVGVVALTAVCRFIHGSQKYPGPALSGIHIDGVALKTRY